MTDVKEDSRKGLSLTTWFFLAVLVQFLIGASMIPLRYLQTFAGLPSMAVVAVSDLAAFSLMAGRMLPRIDRHYWRSKTLWVMVAVVIFRTICITFAVRFTKAYLVQLINLMAPFMVVYLERLINKSPIPKFTFLATCLTTLGGLMMVFVEFSDLSSFNLSSTEDLLGILLAILGTVGIALYMVIVKRGENIHLPFEVFYISQIGAMMIVMTILSLFLGEDWNAFRSMDWRAGLALAFNALIVEIVGKIGNITVIRKLGAPSVSSLQAVRLVAALFMGWLILDERLFSIWQWIGAAMVMVTVTWFVSTKKQVQVENMDDGLDT